MLTLTRAFHLAATLSLGGVFAFVVVIVEPALRRSSIGRPESDALRRRLTALAWASLGTMLASGALWLGLAAQAMSGMRLGDALARGVVATALAHTQFGHVATARFIVALVIAACLCAKRRSPWAGLRAALDGAVLVLAAALAASVAWTGHAAATGGGAGALHLAADAAHLLAATAWLGALIPLGLFLAAAMKADGPGWASAVQTAVRRFSAVGIASVATLLVSGTANTWFLTGTAPALTGTPYGRLLLLKIALFLAMVGVAAVNRFRLTPQLSHVSKGGKARASRSALRRLKRNALIEIGLGVAVLLIVGRLGTLAPGLHTEPTWRLPGWMERESGLFFGILR